MKLIEMKQAHKAALDKAESFLTGAEAANRDLTTTETEQMNSSLAEASVLETKIKATESINTMRLISAGQHIAEPATAATLAAPKGRRLVFSAEYRAAFIAFCASRGTVVTDALREGMDSEGGLAFPAIPKRRAAQYEGSNTAGGYAVPSMVEGTFVPLAPPEMGVYKLASVIPTTMDIRFPRKDAHGTAAAKAESGGSSNSFAGSDPTIGQFTLTANMLGHSEDASWELLQDVEAFQGFIDDDVLLSIAILKETWFVSGNGSGQAQGLIGNTGAGVTGEVADSAGNLLSIDATFDVMGTLNAVYHPGAAWLMQRATSIMLRKAQKQSNLFEAVFTRSNGQDFLHGYPVEYSSAMPSVAAAATPVLFGDFKRGYIIGERGGAGVSIKILDQPKALQGLLTVLGYQRVDGKVRRAEAIQAITLHS